MNAIAFMRTSTFAGLIAMSFVATAQASVHTVIVTADSGAGSLRQAIVDSNADTAAPNTITFAIPGAGPHTITLASQLPNITRSVTIDGFSQSGSVENTHAHDAGGLNGTLQIEVTYGGACCIYGFVVGSKDGVTLTVQGLAINNFGAAAIEGTLQPGTSKIVVYGNYIGTTLDGSAAKGTTGYAVATSATPAQIGGEEPWQRNLVAGTLNGITVASSAVVEGNLVGTDASGTLAIGNANYGIVADFETATARIGGITPAARNVISGNGHIGLLVEHHYAGAGPVDWEIFGNTIGTDWTGTRRIPNGATGGSAPHGGVVFGSSATGFVPSIGGFGEGEANLITWNAGPGISASDNLIYESFDNYGNYIHHNDGARRRNVDIGSTGPTPNDPGDADSGVNNLQNWPDILAASVAGGQLTVSYRVDSTMANSTYPLRVDFYADVQSGSGEWLGEDVYTADMAQATREVTLFLPSGTQGIPFVAVATDANGYSSELSPAFDVIFEDDFDD